MTVRNLVHSRRDATPIEPRPTTHDRFRGDRGGFARVEERGRRIGPAIGSPLAAELPPALAVEGLTVAYHRKPVLRDVTFHLPKGRLAGIVGPNGAGKSTLVKAALGMVPHATGAIRIFGEPHERQRRHVGYVPQRELVDWDFPTDALDVVLMGTYGHLGLFRRPRRADREHAMECLAKVGMADYARRQISQLSGGQQQRVFLARALARTPSSTSWTSHSPAWTRPRRKRSCSSWSR